MGALRDEKIDFMLIGMSAAVLQGVPGSTIDVDYWVDLPSRQYIRVLNICRRVGAKLLANTVVELEDGTLVNFIYCVTGLKSFAVEKSHANHLKFDGLKIAVLPLERVLQSKESVRRPKDLVHIHLIQQTLNAIKKLVRRGKKQ